MSTTGMYRIKPVVMLTGDFKHTSSSMYKMKAININSCIMQTSSNSVPSNSISSCKEFEILSRQEKLLADLHSLQEQLNLFRSKINATKSGREVTNSNDALAEFRTHGIRDIVINADPKYPPYALLWLSKLWNLPVDVSIHLHSSVSSLPEKLTVFKALSSGVPSKESIKVIFVWKEVGVDTQLIVSPVKNKVIRGEVNILRFFETFTSKNENLVTKTKNNEVLDIAHRLNHVSGKEVYSYVNKLSSILGTDNSFAQKFNPSVVDVAVWSVLCRKTRLNALPSNIQKWTSSYSTVLGFSCFEERS